MDRNNDQQLRTVITSKGRLSSRRMMWNQLVLKSPIIKNHLLPLSGYLLFTTFYTWPTLPHFFTHIPGAGDAPWFLWQFWWFKHALLDLHQSPYVTNLIYYPLQDVPVMAQTPVNEVFSLPLQVAFNVVILNNLLFVLTYLFSGYFTYLLGITLTRRRGLAFVGGLLFAFCSYRGIRSLGHMSLLTTQWMPLFLLAAIQCGRRPSWQRGVAAGLAASLVALSSPYYIGLFLFPVVLVGALYIVFWRRDLIRQKELWLAGIVGGIAFIALTVPLYFHYLQLEPEIYTINDTLQTGAAIYSADLLSWWLPSGMHPLWQPFTASIYRGFTTANLVETTLFVGYLPLILFLLSFGLRPYSSALHFWQMLALFTWSLSLGPMLHFYGQALFAWMPYRFLIALPGFGSFRIPSRAGVTAALALSVITMLVLDQMMRRYRRVPWPLILSIGALLVFVNNLAIFPFPQTDSRIPTIYTEVAENAAATAIMELPAGEYFHRGNNFFGEVSKAMYYQSYHQKPIVSGYLGRRPARLAEPEHTMPFVRHFFTDEANQPPINFPTRPFLPEPFQPGEIEQAPWLLHQLGIRYVALHTPVALSGFAKRAIPILNEALGLPGQVDGAHRLYRVQPPLYQSYGAPLSPLLAVVPVYNEAFSTAFLDEQSYARTVLKDAEIRFTIPFTGVWSLQGTWIGSTANEVQPRLDGVPLALQHDAYTDYTIAWQTMITVTPGLHHFSLPLPSASQATTNEPCMTLCLRDLRVRLAKPIIPAAATPLATFVNETNQKAELLTTTFLSTAKAVDPALQTAWLMTVWRLDEATFAQVQSEPQRLPALYVHFTTPDGQTQWQADHVLGERRLILADAPILFDLIPLSLLPEDYTGNFTGLELRLGLWYPENRTYFWSTDPARVDGGNRFTLGSLAAWQQEFDPPAIPIDQQHKTIFTTADDQKQFVLLQARIVQDENNGKPPFLLTIWRTPYNFDSADAINMLVYTTDASGASIPEAEHRLGADNLLDSETHYLIDRMTLPSSSLASENKVFWLALAQQENAVALTAIPTKALMVDNRVRLGTWAELVAGYAR